jgi:hypothetical protein
MTDKRIEIIHRVLELIEDEFYSQKRNKDAYKKWDGNCIIDSIESIRESLDHLNYLITRRI